MSKENIFNDFTPEQIESFEDYYAGVAGEIDKRSAAWGYLMGTMSPSEPTEQPVMIARCAKAVADVCSDDRVMSVHKLAAKAVLDAAGVKYE